MEIQELSKMLAEDTAGVCRYLFPSGKVVSGNFCVGGLDGQEGQSLRVKLEGDKKGVWTDFAFEGSDKGGDLIDLWRRSRGISLVQTLEEVKKYLGVKDDMRFVRPTHKVYARPKSEKNLIKKGPVADYLLGRGLTKETIRAYKIEESKSWVGFPFYKGEERVKCKYLNIERKDGKKAFYVDPSDSEPVLFGWQIVGDERAITIDEGEINAMSLYQYGHPCLSVPFGAGDGDKNQWIDHEYDRLNRFDMIYIRADSDGPGLKMIDDLVKRLGRHRCRILKLPADPNDCLMQGMTKEEIDQYYAEAEFVHPSELKGPLDFSDLVIKRFYPDPHTKNGFIPRFQALQGSSPEDRPKLEFRYGEVTVWGGYNFEGKSQMIKQMQLDAISQHDKVLVLDFEQLPDITLHRLVRSITTQVYPVEGYIEKALHWMDNKLWLFDTSSTGGATLEKTIELFTYAAKRFGVNQFFLDSLMRISDVPEDNIDAQRNAINMLCAFAKEYNAHVHIVAHFRKPNFGSSYTDISRPPSRFEISGSSKFSDAAFNVILIHRNRLKEDVLSGKIDPPEGYSVDYFRDKPDGLMNIDKQKNGESWVGFVKLWWSQEAQQFMGAMNDKPHVYIDLKEKFKV